MVTCIRKQGLPIAIGEQVPTKMIFRYCGWPAEAKDEDRTTSSEDREIISHEKNVNSRKKEFKITETVLRCCPCVFRCRKSVDVGKESEESVSTISTTANTTPVIALRLNRSNDTIDKAVNEEEYNERNKHHFLPETTDYHVQPLNTAETGFEVDERERIVSKRASSSSSDILRSSRQQNVEQNVDGQNCRDSRSSTPQSQDGDAAFNIITSQSAPLDRDTVDSYAIALGQKLEHIAEPTITSVEDDTSKDWSSEEDAKLRSQEAFQEVNQNESEYSTPDEVEPVGERTSVRRRSVVSILSNERILTSEALQTSGTLHSSCSKEFNEIEASPSRRAGSPKKSEVSYLSRSPSRNSNEFEALKSPLRRSSRSSPHKLSFDRESAGQRESSEERVLSSILHDENGSFQSLDPSPSRRGSKADSATIIIASRPHSNEAPNYTENKVEASVQLEADNPRRFIDESTLNEGSEDKQSKGSASETNAEPAILKIETRPVEINAPRRMPSKVPRGTGRLRTNINKGNVEKPEKSKPIVQQCFTQLESKDWEITMKGLKTLSQITKQHPEYLDICAAGTIGRLLGRHIKNLRSQVARAACLAAGEIFSSQIRGIDQDIDDIAGPLLHRTADTNRFLRADSNAALDRMVEHLPPHKTIGIIVHRGAGHQNAIVRAATARLLAEIVDRIGPENTMILPRDVRDKLLSTGARLLIDGNLDARNHAKKMFRRLTPCEGFRRALIDAVPETTLRHIDKTLKSL